MSPLHSTLDERSLLLLPTSSHDWLHRFISLLQHLQPDVTSNEAIEVAIGVYDLAQQFEPEDVAVLTARKRTSLCQRSQSS